MTGLASGTSAPAMRITLLRLMLAFVSVIAYCWTPEGDDPIFCSRQAPIVGQITSSLKRHHVAEQAPLKITLRYAMRLRHSIPTLLSQSAIRCFLVVSTLTRK